MTNLTRVTGKIFGETASTSNTPKEIGQFGSAKAGTYNATGDVATIQNLSAWSNGWIDAVTPTQQFPSLPEMTGVHKVLSYQEAYLLQKGVAEWDSNTTYYTGDFCKGVGEGKLYVSKVDNNTNHALTDGAYWEEFSSGALDGKMDTDGTNAVSSVKFADGQWVKSYLVLATNVTQSFSDGAVDYSLSSYLPNDNYKYEVLFSGFGEGSTTSSGLYLYLTTDTIGDTSEIIAGSNYNGAQIVRAKGTAYGSGCVALPVGSARKVTTFCSNSSNGKYYLIALGYRRIGTNQ